MSKFESGKKVIVRDSVHEELVDKTATLLERNLVQSWIIQFEDGRKHSIHEDYIELIEQDFTIKDLKDGMIVIRRDGDRAVVFEGNLLRKHDGYARYEPLSKYNEDLTHKSMKELDIIKVRFDGKLIFERKMTDLDISILEANITQCMFHFITERKIKFLEEAKKQLEEFLEKHGEKDENTIQLNNEL